MGNIIIIHSPAAAWARISGTHHFILSSLPICCCTTKRHFPAIPSTSGLLSIKYPSIAWCAAIICPELPPLSLGSTHPFPTGYGLVALNSQHICRYRGNHHPSILSAFVYHYFGKRQKDWVIQIMAIMWVLLLFGVGMLFCVENGILFLTFMLLCSFTDKTDGFGWSQLRALLCWAWWVLVQPLSSSGLSSLGAGDLSL